MMAVIKASGTTVPYKGPVCTAPISTTPATRRSLPLQRDGAARAHRRCEPGRAARERADVRACSAAPHELCCVPAAAATLPAPPRLSWGALMRRMRARRAQPRADPAAVAAAGVRLLRPHAAAIPACSSVAVHDGVDAVPSPRADGMLQCQRRGCGALYTEARNTAVRALAPPLMSATDVHRRRVLTRRRASRCRVLLRPAGRVRAPPGDAAVRGRSEGVELLRATRSNVLRVFCAQGVRCGRWDGTCARVAPRLTRVALRSCSHDEHTQGAEEVGPTRRETAMARRRAAEHHLFSDP